MLDLMWWNDFCVLIVIVVSVQWLAVVLTLSHVHRWGHQVTTGSPPLGVLGCASCVNRSDAYYFGGGCGHDDCYHNSLHSLNMYEWKWRQLFATSDSGPMKKSRCGMVAFHESLLVVGGYGTPPKHPQASAHYDGGRYVRTNEHHIWCLGTGELITSTYMPVVSKSVAMVTVMSYGLICVCESCHEYKMRSCLKRSTIVLVVCALGGRQSLIVVELMLTVCDLGRGELISVVACAVGVCRMSVGDWLLKDRGSLRW